MNTRVCTCIHMLHTHISVHTHTLCTHIHAQVRRHLSAHPHKMYMCSVHACAHTRIHAHARAYTHVHTHCLTQPLTCAFTWINTHLLTCPPPHRDTHAHRCLRPCFPPPSRAVGRVHLAAPSRAALPGFRRGSAASACSPPPSSFRWLFSPLPPGCKAIHHCLPWTPGLGHAVLQAGNPLSRLSPGLFPSFRMLHEIPQQASLISQARPGAPSFAGLLCAHWGWALVRPRPSPLWAPESRPCISHCLGQGPAMAYSRGSVKAGAGVGGEG